MDILIPILVIAGLGLAFGLGLSYASKVFEVKVDERIAAVREMLPGANCGACGYSGCDGLAEAIVNEGAPASRCPVGGVAAANAISDYMGVDEGSIDVKEARVLCQGTCENTAAKYEYNGIDDCHAANLLSGGMNACNFGCIGLGSCKKVCMFDAIVVENGLARVIPENCTGCGKCVAECPKNIIKLIPVMSGFTVKCSSHDKGALTRKNCTVGCIGCQKCVKACPNAAIAMNNNLAVIDAEKCINCGECEKVCPQKCIANTIVKRFA
ncbi:MAG TPA: ferredoxin [Ruminiclostridium sp.]|nr:ferredoxin [Ruminiclostridium sp.]